MPINRPLKSWNFELQDPSWRRWFDTLKALGVGRLGGVRSSVPMSAATPLEDRFGYSSRELEPELQSTADPSFQRPINEEAPTIEPHDKSVARQKSIEERGLAAIRRTTGR